MSIPTDRLREIADGAMGIGAPLVLTQAEQVAACTELLACREEREKHITAMAAIAQRHLDAAAERDAARAELAAVKRQRDELLEAAKLAIREIRSSTDCSMCHDSTWDHECDCKVNTTHVALSNAIKGALAAEQPKPKQPDVPFEPRPWWVVFGLERWEATKLHALHPSQIERRLGGMVDIAGKRQIHPTEIARALDEARAELLPKPQQPEVQP